MSINLTLLIVMGVLYACGIYLILERSLTRVLLGLMLLANATNILILSTGGYAGLAPLFDKETNPETYNDPLPPGPDPDVDRHFVRCHRLYARHHLPHMVLARQDEIQDDLEDVRVAKTPSFDAEDDAIVPLETSEFAITPGQPCK